MRYTEEDFKKKLNPEAYRCLREKGTEVAHTGKYLSQDTRGIYTCGACGNPLFLSYFKFDAKDGWPAFSRPLTAEAVWLVEEEGQTEVRCGNCESHIGYVVDKDEKHYRVNSIGLGFTEIPDLPKKEDGGEKEQEKNTGNQNTNSAGSTGATVASSGIKTITFTIGGIAVGVVATVGATQLMPQTPPVCVPTQTEATSTPATPTNTATTTSTLTIPPRTNPTSNPRPTPTPTPATTTTTTVGTPIITGGEETPAGTSAETSNPNSDLPQ